MNEDVKADSSSKRAARLFSVIVILCAIVLPFFVYWDLKANPRTDDAQIRANVAGVAPQVGGTIIELHVVDNQLVHRGDLLFEIDPRPYAAEADLAKAQLSLTDLEIQADKDNIASAEATLKERQVRQAYSDSYYQRVSVLLAQRYVTPDKVELANTDAVAAKSLVEEAQASLQRAHNLLGEADGINVRRVAAEAALRDAELKLAYCRVYANCDGFVTNLQIAPGAYAAAGEQIFSIVDRRVWFVLANFRETDLNAIRPGMPAEVYLMAESGRRLKGVVQGVSKAIYPIEGGSGDSAGGAGVLERVRPTIDFILLAQRYPVRIVLDEPESLNFRMGGTAMVVVHTGRGTEAGEAFLKRVKDTGRSPYEAPAP